MMAFKSTNLTVIICIISIISISYGLFFYLQNNTENNIKNSLFEKQKQLQIESTKELAQHIGSDLDSIMARQQGLTNLEYIQKGGSFYTNGSTTTTNDSNNTLKILKKTFSELNAMTPIDRFFVLNKYNIVTASIPNKFVNLNFSDKNWVKQTKNSLLPGFSNGFENTDGKDTITLTYPILNIDTGQYMGLISSLLPALQFFQHYGNIHNISSQYFVVLDKKSIQLIHPLKSLIGKPFFGEYTQQITGHNEALNNLVKQVISGKSGSAIYNFINGERLNTGYPIFIQGVPAYFVFEITPTSYIYSSINRVILNEKIESFSLLAGITAAIAALVIFLIRWNNILNKQIKKRTIDLDISNNKIKITAEELKRTNESLAESNNLLVEKNKQLEIHDKMQKEFINVAAHELRTPTQAIIGFSELLELDPENGKSFADPILRNAKRLNRLTNDVLDVTKIESKMFNLRMQQFNLKDLIITIINDLQQQIRSDIKNKNIEIVYDNTIGNSDIFINADKARITQVISNLIDNAIKFTENGKIYINIDKKKMNDNNSDEVIVSIKDTGSGIHADIYPRLFSKFASKSYQGTGLGLFISKSIIKAHGGAIWAENNANGRGAKFTFSLPIKEK
ncbi:MAG TPA: ATP-binding protein [Candidatus Nitrosocosmicus sp.]